MLKLKSRHRLCHRFLMEVYAVIRLLKIIVGTYTDAGFDPGKDQLQNYAQLEMKFPEREPGYYGSVLSMCKSSYLEELTNKRIKELEEWIEGCEEGDVCCGSVKRFY